MLTTLNFKGDLLKFGFEKFVQHMCLKQKENIIDKKYSTQNKKMKHQQQKVRQTNFVVYNVGLKLFVQLDLDIVEGRHIES